MTMISKKHPLKENPFHSIWSPFFNSFLDLTDEERAPRCGDTSGLEISEDDQNFYIQAALPGIAKENIQVTTLNRELKIEGSRSVKETPEKKIHRKSKSKFSYLVTLPEAINESSSFEADLKDGMLTVTCPKKETSSIKSIPIRS